MLLRISNFRPHFPRALAAVFFLFIAFVRAQAQGDPLAGVSMEDLEKKEYTPTRTKTTAILRGDTSLDPKDEQQVKGLDAMVRFTLYRFYDVRAKEAGFVDRVFQEFEDGQLKLILMNKEKNQGVPQLYTKLMIQHGKLVLQTPKPIARLNAARVLARLTKLGQPELADALLEILKQELQYDVKAGDPRRNDGVKLYVLRGLGEMLALQTQTQPQLSKELEQKIVLALAGFIERKAPLEKSATAEEVEGYRLLRREAVRGLANGLNPSVVGNEKSQPALVLLRVVARDDIAPEPRMDERVEAAVGVLRLNPEMDKTYQQDYAVYQVALFVDAFLSNVNKAKEELKPVKIYAVRLYEALDALKTSKNATVKKIAERCLDPNLLLPVEASGAIKPEDVTSFKAWLVTNAVQKDSLFEGVKNSTVKAANRPVDDEPDK